LAVLALPSDLQIEWLQSLGDVGQSADELALEFDDGYVLLWHFIPENWLALDIRPILDEINRLFDDMSGPTGPWSFDELESDPRWEQVRGLAQRALMAIT
jgi:hypothetical protein